MAESVSELVEISGHLMDSGILSRVLDDIREYGGDYVIVGIDIGHEAHDTSHATLKVSSADEESLDRLLMRLQFRGVNQVDPGEASTRRAERDGVFPEGFYSTTNLPTTVRLNSRWVPVVNPEMDCGLVVDGEGDQLRILTVPMSDVRAGMRIVCGADGIRVETPEDEVSGGFGFMESDVSSEKPQAVLVRQVADGMRETRARGEKILIVGGPRGVHTHWLPTTSSRRSMAPRWGSISARGTASSTDTSITSAPSTRSARPARSRTPSTPAYSPVGSCTRSSPIRSASSLSARSATTDRSPTSTPT
jgi:hypothetical protein